MFSLALILAVISLPIFTIYGFISFLQLFFGGSKKNQNQLLFEIVADLETLKNKNTTVSILIDKYKNKLPGINSSPQPVIVPSVETTVPEAIPAAILETTEQKPTVEKNIENWWENWYQDNNINLLLYVGSFLIVSSAAIFVGFNWETFTGTFKAFILILITLIFFFSGFFFFFQTPKLKNAGSTFLAIGSLLIPFNGLAWYNFVLRDAGMDFGSVWLFTSLIAAITYFSLALLIKNRFYTYIAGLGTLSLVEALVNVSSLNTRFYVLGGIFSAFTLLAGSKLLATTKKEEFDKLYSEPLNISSQITMPIFLGWGLILASTQGQLFTLEATLSAFLACLFYLTTFTLQRNMVYLVLAELLASMSLVLGLKTFDFHGVVVYSGLFLLCFAFQAISFFWSKIGKQQESYYTVFTATFVGILALSFAFIDPLINPQQRVYFTLIVSIIAALAAIVSRQPTYLYLTIGGLDLAGFVYVDSVLQRTNWLNNLGLIYFAFSTFLFATNLLKDKLSQLWKEVFTYSAYSNVLLAILFVLNSPNYLLFIALFTLAITAVLKYLNSQVDVIYSAITATALALLAIGVSFLLPSYSTSEKIYFAIVATGIAFLSTYLERRPEYLFVAFAGVDLAAFLQVGDLHLGKKTNNYLSVTFLVLGIAQYISGILTWNNLQKWSGNLLTFAAINFLLALGFALPSAGYSLMVSSSISFFALVGLYYLRKEEVGYIGTLFACITVINLFRFYHIESEFYPLAFSSLSYAFYFSSFIGLPEVYTKLLRQSGLILGFTNPVVFGLYAQNTQNNYYYDGYQYQQRVEHSSLELFSLISAYLTTLILSLEAYRSKAIQLGYLASVAGLVSLLWHFKFLDVQEIQMYSITTAVYLFAIGYSREKLGKDLERQNFDYAALAILLSPTLWQALPESGFSYALLLGFEGIVLLAVGLSTNHKTFTYAGVAALVLATLTRVYSFIASLDSWAIIGSVGLVFLVMAIYLLSKRKDQS